VEILLIRGIDADALTRISPAPALWLNEDSRASRAVQRVLPRRSCALSPFSLKTYQTTRTHQRFIDHCFMSLSQIGFVHAQRPSGSQHESRNQGRSDTHLSDRSKENPVSVSPEGA